VPEFKTPKTSSDSRQSTAAHRSCRVPLVLRRAGPLDPQVDRL